MNKKDISEIKKLFTREKSCITRIAGCYVSAEKEKILQFKEAFSSVPEEEMYKYFDIFRKGLSGTIGKNLLNMEFPLNQELEEGKQTELLALKDSELKNEELLDAFYDKMIETYIHPENYLILLIHGIYDIPLKTSDGIENEDASDYVYSFISCYLCPVHLTKGGLVYNAEENRITDRLRDWIVDMPEQAFLFPTFNDRNTDLHSLLYYTKKSEVIAEEIMEDILGCVQPITAGIQKESFQAIVEEALGDECVYEVVRNLHETIHEMIEEEKDNPDPVVLDKTDLKHLLQRSGAPEEALEVFEEKYTEHMGDHQKVLAKNITETKKFEVTASDVIVKVNPERADLVETKIIDGKRCLVIELNDAVAVNGIHILPEREENEEGNVSETV